MGGVGMAYEDLADQDRSRAFDLLLSVQETDLKGKLSTSTQKGGQMENELSVDRPHAPSHPG